MPSELPATVWSL